MTVSALSPESVEAVEAILDNTISVQGADMGNIQLLNEQGVMEIVAQVGFQKSFLDHFRFVRPYDDCACGRALRFGSAVVIADVQQDPEFAAHREIAAAAGFRAVQSMPLLNASGSVVGMLSVHYRSPLTTPHWRLQSLRDAARQIANAVCSVTG